MYKYTVTPILIKLKSIIRASSRFAFLIEVPFYSMKIVIL